MPDILNNATPSYIGIGTDKKRGLKEAILSWGGINSFLKHQLVELLLRIVGMSGISETYSFVTQTGVDTYILPSSIGRITISKVFYDGKLLNTLVAQDYTYTPSTGELKFNIDTFDNVECVIEYY
ncbi:MAG: hypothetical protein JST04_00690 [Bdellovibrionales bacterium]|nr:hypothetical protein [Bdellovibrionales bacterium]